MTLPDTAIASTSLGNQITLEGRPQLGVKSRRPLNPSGLVIAVRPIA
jgi:hypothetical protein